MLFLHFSGHGSNVPDDNGDEADNRDEILCPTDLDWYDPLRDDWLRNVFDGLRAGVSLTVITDCCHSGTITRAIEPPDAPIIERYLPSPWDLVAVESGRSLTGTARGRCIRRRRPSELPATSFAVDIPEVLISGCRADQTSADAAIAGGFAGALTYNLVEALTEAEAPLSYRDLHDQTRAKLKHGRYEQFPQLEGNEARLDQPFLSRSNNTDATWRSSSRSTANAMTPTCVPCGAGVPARDRTTESPTCSTTLRSSIPSISRRRRAQRTTNQKTSNTWTMTCWRSRSKADSPRGSRRSATPKTCRC